MNVRDDCLDYSTEEGELKGIENKLKLNTTLSNQVISEGVIFSSRYLFKVITTQRVDPADLVAI